MDRMAGIELKLERAGQHLIELEDAIKDFWPSQPNFPDPDKKTSSQQLEQFVQGLRIPESMAAIVDDALQNLRSPLDYLIHRLIDANEKAAGTHDYFPTGRNPSAYESGLKGLRDKIGDHAFEMMKAIQPYPGGAQEGLWQLHQLNKGPKHITPSITAAYLYDPLVLDVSHFMRQTFPQFADKIPPMAPLLIEPSRGQPVEAVTNLGQRSNVWPQDSPEKVNRHITLQIAFGQGTVAEGSSVTGTLHRFMDLVRGTIEPFRPLLQ